MRFFCMSVVVWMGMTMASSLVWAQQSMPPELLDAVLTAVEQAHQRANPGQVQRQMTSEDRDVLQAQRLEAVKYAVANQLRKRSPKPIVAAPGDVSNGDEVDPHASDLAFHAHPPLSVEPGMLRANCGPILLAKVFAKHGIHTTLETLIEQSNTQRGLTSLYDMRRTVHEQTGLYVEGVATTVDALAKFIQLGDVICHFTKNNHYILIDHIDDKLVRYVDPSWSDREGATQTVWRHVFERQWEGICLIISDKPLGLSDAGSSSSAGDSQ